MKEVKIVMFEFNVQSKGLKGKEGSGARIYEKGKKLNPAKRTSMKVLWNT